MLLNITYLKNKFIERPLKMDMKHQPSPMQYKIIRGKTPRKKNINKI
jgi:hypothetical protein